jgi:hypothetical protein
MNDSPRNALGYLAAFTLGVLCMAAIVLVIRIDHSGREPAIVHAKTGAAPALRETPIPGKQTFNRLHEQGSVSEASLEHASEGLANSAAPESTGNGSVPPYPGARNPSTVVPIISQPPSPGRRAALASTFRGGRISGKVALRGEPPPEHVLPLDPACAAVFDKPPTTQLYVVGKDSGLGDVVVSLRLSGTGQSWSPPAGPAILAERHCRIEPYVSAIQAGQKLLVQNEDRVLHNLHMTSEANGELNRTSLPSSGKKIEVTLDHPEDFVRFSCGVHVWEYGYVSVFSHPFFAVTDRNGDFVIPNVPPGKYVIEARHRKAGTVSKEIEVMANRGSTVDFSLDVPVVAQGSVASSD